MISEMRPSSSLTGSGTALLAAHMRGTAQGWVLGSVKVDGFGTPSVRYNSGVLASLPTYRYHSSNLMGANAWGRRRGVVDRRPLFSRGWVASRGRVERLRWTYLEAVAAGIRPGSSAAAHRCSVRQRGEPDHASRG
jgi:hypothetical protein